MEAEMKTLAEITPEERGRASELAENLVSANIRHLESNCLDECAAEEIRSIRRELQKIGFVVQCVNFYDFKKEKYTSQITLYTPKNIH